MSDLTDALKRVKAGESKFEPLDQTLEALVGFQPIGKALSHANKEGFLEKCVFSKDSVNGDLYYNAFYVIGGLSFKGEEFLRSETTLKGQLLKHAPSFFQWFFGIAAGLILAALVNWLVP